VEAGEQCDHGRRNGAPGDTCAADCNIVIAVCGNGVPERGEQCDDGERNGGAEDGCLADCTMREGVVPGCGNSVVELGELCDEGEQNGVSGGSCDASCGAATWVQGQFNDLTAHFSGGAQANLLGIGAFRALPVATGPASLALMTAGAAVGIAWIRRKRRL